MDATGPILPTPGLPPPPSAFPPPTLPAPSAVTPDRESPTAQAHTEAVVGPAPSKRSASGLVVGGLATLAVAALAVIGFVIVDGAADDGGVELATEVDETASESAGFSYAAASADARTAASLSIDMSIETSDGAQKIQTRLDRETVRMEMEVDLAQFDQGENDFAIDGAIGMIVDGQDDTVYVTANVFGGLFGDAGDGWFRIDSNEFDDGGSGFDQMFDNPLTVTDVLGELDPTDLGQESVDGEILRHFRVTVDPATLEASGITDWGVSGSGLTAGSEVTYDVWVSEDDRVRRITFDATDPESQDRATVQMDIETSSESIVIDLPSTDEIIDLDEVFGDGLELES